MPKFIITQGANQGTEIPAEGKMLVFGRSDECDVVMADPNVSRRHAHAVMLNGMMAMVDLGSSNGTLVNGIPISRIFLMDGDEIQLGGSIFQYVEDRELNAEVGSVRPDSISEISSRALLTADDVSLTPSGDALSHTKLFAPMADDMKIDVLKDIYLKLKSLYRIFTEVAQAASLKEMFEAVGRGVTISTAIERTVFFLNAEKSGGG